MCRNNLILEILAIALTFAVGTAVFLLLPVAWFIAAPAGIFAAYVVLDTLLPTVWETPPKGIRYEPGDDDE